MPTSMGMTHKEYVLDRARRIEMLFHALESDNVLRKQFFETPAGMGERYGIAFSHEEIYGIASMRNGPLADLREWLVLNESDVFDRKRAYATFRRGRA